MIRCLQFVTVEEVQQTVIGPHRGNVFVLDTVRRRRWQTDKLVRRKPYIGLVSIIYWREKV
jgi:hypothetical protein